MPQFAGFGTTLVIILAVVLWIVYLVPMWTRRREYLATERNAVRLQQTLRVMAESAEAPEELRIEVDARTVAMQQRAVAKEARLKQAVEHAKAVARARELDEQIRIVERQAREAVRASVSRAQRLKRTRLACLGIAVLGLAGVLLGLAAPGLLLVTIVASLAFLLGVAGLVSVNASSARMRRKVAASPPVTTVADARIVAAAAETQAFDVAADRRAHPPHKQRTEELRNAALASRSWTPGRVPAQRPRLEHTLAERPGDALLQRARERLAEDRRAISGPVAPVTRIEPSFDAIVNDQADEMEVVAESAPSPAVPATPASGASRFASMGVIDSDIDGVDLQAAFSRRRVG